LHKLLLPPLLAATAALCTASAKAGEGAPIVLARAPDGSAGWIRACSLRTPGCVHGSPGTTSRSVLDALAALDRAWSSITEALDLPPPDPSLDGAWHVYLVDGVEGGSTAQLTERDPLTRLDRGASMGLVDRSVPAGCAMDFAMARAVVRGSIWATAPATDVGSARAESQMVARIVAPCASTEADARAFQDQPERTLVDPSSPTFDRGASMFFDWLDSSFSARPAAMLAGTWALAPTRTPARAWAWSGAPNGFDVLHVSLAGALSESSTFDDVLTRFAVHRALTLPPAHLAWHVPWPSKARRFASPTPVSPTGASFVLVDLAGAPAKASLRVEAEWEDFGRMRWDVVKLDATGRELADVAVTSLPLGTTASMTIETLDGVDRVLIVGVNIGSTEHPFDPNQGWWEPHGWLLTIEGE
jgi:hypothetical protein